MTLYRDLNGQKIIRIRQIIVDYEGYRTPISQGVAQLDDLIKKLGRERVSKTFASYKELVRRNNGLLLALKTEIDKFYVAYDMLEKHPSNLPPEMRDRIYKTKYIKVISEIVDNLVANFRDELYFFDLLKREFQIYTRTVSPEVSMDLINEQRKLRTEIDEKLASFNELYHRRKDTHDLTEVDKLIKKFSGQAKKAVDEVNGGNYRRAIEHYKSALDMLDNAFETLSNAKVREEHEPTPGPTPEQYPTPAPSPEPTPSETPEEVSDDERLREVDERLHDDSEHLTEEDEQAHHIEEEIDEAEYDYDEELGYDLMARIMKHIEHPEFWDAARRILPERAESLERQFKIAEKVSAGFINVGDKKSAYETMLSFVKHFAPALKSKDYDILDIGEVRSVLQDRKLSHEHRKEAKKIAKILMEASNVKVEEVNPANEEEESVDDDKVIYDVLNMLYSNLDNDEFWDKVAEVRGESSERLRNNLHSTISTARLLINRDDSESAKSDLISFLKILIRDLSRKGVKILELDAVMKALNELDADQRKIIIGIIEELMKSVSS